MTSPTPDEAEPLVRRAIEVSESSGLPFKLCLAALRDVIGWQRPR